jgi:hypothetical protein
MPLQSNTLRAHGVDGGGGLTCPGDCDLSLGRLFQV